MTRGPVLLDTGPLVAILNQTDGQHKRCVNTLRRLPTPLVTCWPVITEAAWILRRRTGLPARLLRAFDGDLFEIEPIEQTAGTWLAEFHQQYGPRDVQLADACLMYLANRHDIRTIFTLDMRDFSIFRTEKGRTLRILPE